jgi:hypothetical protein
MKKQLSILFFACFLLNNANAQLGFGAKVGLNVNLITFSDSDVDSQSGLGFHAGGLVSYRLNDNLYTNAEILFSSRGISFTDEETEDGVKYEYDDKSTFNYIEVPLLVGWGKTNGLQIQAGPAFNLLLGGKDKSTTTITDGSEVTTETREISGADFKEGLTSMVIGAALGVGYNLESGINVNVRLQRSLNSLYDFDGLDLSANWNTISVSLGYNF